MKTKFACKLLSTILFLSSICISAKAQRRVVVTKPSQTVVVTRVPRSRVMYINPRVITPPRPVVVRTIPTTSVTIAYGHSRYYYYGGVYYVQRPEGYVVINPPVGVIITVPPAGFVRVTAYSCPYLYFEGIFYKEVPEGYKIVTPPVGAQIPKIPEGAEKVSIEGKIFYEYHGTLYKKVETETGFAYEVSGNVEN
jgi:hypothetical protein